MSARDGLDSDGPVSGAPAYAPRLPDGHLSHEDWLDLLGDDSLNENLASPSTAGDETDAAASVPAGGR